jgi:bifunctional DNase/RNase
MRTSRAHINQAIIKVIIEKEEEDVYYANLSHSKEEVFELGQHCTSDMQIRVTKTP